jgi:hypothetical protein
VVKTYVQSFCLSKEEVWCGMGAECLQTMRLRDVRLEYERREVANVGKWTWFKYRQAERQAQIRSAGSGAGTYPPMRPNQERKRRKKAPPKK